MFHDKIQQVFFDIKSRSLQQESPSFYLLKEEESRYERTNIFYPRDLMCLIINNTSNKYQTYVKIIDNRYRVRYHGKSAATYHKFTTRLQDTQSYGGWKFVVEAPLSKNNEFKIFEILFSVNKCKNNKYHSQKKYVTVIDDSNSYKIRYVNKLNR